MRNDLIKTNTPEEDELATKKAEIEKLSQLLAVKELDLEELKLTVVAFHRRYYFEVGKRYVELDELRAQIAEIKARQTPQDNELNQEAVRTRTQARKAAEEYEGAEIEPQADSPMPEKTEHVKKLYRKVASVIHPDKTTDEKSRHLRTKLMAELNEAYARKDVAKMQNILDRWQESPEAISGEGAAAELVRTIRAIAQVKRRKSEIETEISTIMTSDIYVLMAKVHDADLAGRDILAEMSISIDYEIQDARNELARLKR
ncbi:MAG: J domain-containing protein [Sedimentisphaerales bacterium]|jgi:hypothetical protein